MPSIPPAGLTGLVPTERIVCLYVGQSAGI